MNIFQLKELAETNGASQERHFIGSAISAAASIGGALIGSKTSKDNASNANQFTERQLKNRHQWEVEDLRKAGLNPILSAHTSPSIGQSAVAQTPDFGGAVSDGISSGTGADLAKDQKKLLKEQKKKVKDEATKARQDTRTSRAQESMLKDQAFQYFTQAQKTGAETDGIHYDNMRRALDASIYGGKTGKMLRYGELIAPIIQQGGKGAADMLQFGANKRNSVVFKKGKR